MIIKVSKVFANYVNKVAKAAGKQFHAEVVQMLPGWDFDESDYDWSTGTVKSLQVSYPYEYYACPKYASTRDLNKEFRRRGVSNEHDLIEMIIDLFEI